MTVAGSNEPTRVAVLTPAGRGAIAVVAVAGPAAAELVEQQFSAASGRLLRQVPVDRIVFGRWGGEGGEEVVVCRRHRHVEVHCHGGQAASRAICNSLLARGATEVSAADWLACQPGDPLAAEAWHLLAQAPTERTALVLLDQYHGALREEVTSARLWIEQGKLSSVAEAVQRLLDRRLAGQWLSRPARVVLAGPPNVGKSSLINAMVGFERAIVFDLPGTTRDSVTALTAIDGWPVQLTDTAGLRDATGEVERAGVDRARRAIAEADLVVLVDGASRWLDQQDLEAAELGGPLETTSVLRVANKVDLLDAAGLHRAQAQAGGQVLFASAVNRVGIEELLAAVHRSLVPVEIEPGAGVPFLPLHVEHLTAAHTHLVAGDALAAGQALQALLAGGR